MHWIESLVVLMRMKGCDTSVSIGKASSLYHWKEIIGTYAKDTSCTPPACEPLLNTLTSVGGAVTKTLIVTENHYGPLSAIFLCHIPFSCIAAASRLA